MRYFIFIISLIISANIYAQQDSLSQKKGYVRKLRETLKKDEQKIDPFKILKQDTIKSISQNKIDSLKNSTTHPIDSLKSIHLTKGVNHKSDSLQSLVNKPTNVIEKGEGLIETKIGHKVDSIESGLSGKGSKLTSLPKGLKHKSDSLENRVTKVGTDLNKKVEGVNQNIQHETDKVTHKAINAVTSTESKLENKVKQVTGTGENVNVPGTNKLNASGVKVPDLKTSGVDFPGVSNTDTKIPSLDSKLPAGNVTKELSSEIPKTGEIDISKGIPSVKDGVSEINLPKTDDLGKVKDLSSELKMVDGKLAGAEKYEGEAQKLKNMDAAQVEKQAEGQLKNVNQVKGLGSEITKAQQIQAQQEALLQKYRDQKLLEQEIKRKASKVANDFMGQHATEVKNAQAQLTKSKKGLHSIKNFNDLFKRRSDELVGKKFYQRLLPGITTQVYQLNKIVSIDAGLQVGYRISPRFTAGIGGLYRSSFNNDFKYYVKGTGVYGGRVYMDLTAYKGIFVHGEFEMLKLDSSRMISIQTKEPIPSKVYGSYFGLGKKINISRRIKGSVMGLYRVEYDGKLPSIKKLNMRLGFDYIIGKKKKTFGIK
ncbi:MAG TPA: hypothetical protein VL443_21770 [Cyclobacteriaceae bacterium]|nr:hypothetical protein [Cyclobacteriaceae bacterium]